MTKSHKEEDKDTQTKSKAIKSKSSESQSYFAVSIVFLVAGLAMVIPENSRAAGIPFLVLGFTFYVISQQESSSKRKK